MGDSALAGYAMGQSNSQNGWGADGGGWFWIIIILLFCGWGRNGWGNNGGGENEMVGYQLGGVATQADVAAGFNNSAVLGKLNDLTLGQSNIQQTLCQGFGGINTSILTSTAGIERAIDNVNYNMAKNTCDITNTINCSTQQILGYLAQSEYNRVKDERDNYRTQLSQNAQTAQIVNTLRPTPIPAYQACSPYQALFGNSCFGNFQ